MALFDDSEFAETSADDVEQEQPAEPVQQEPSSLDEGLEEQVQEATARLEEINYYRTLMHDSMFDAGPVADRVNARLREFAKREIASIVGRTAPANEADKESARKLKLLAQLTEPQIATLAKFLSNMDDQRLSILGIVIDRIAANPTLVHNIIAPAIRKPAAPTAPARQEVTKPKPKLKPMAAPPPVAKPAAPPPQRKSVPARAPTRRPAPIAAPQPPKDEVRRTPLANLRSPTSLPMPTGEELTSKTQALADGAVGAGKKRMMQDAKESLERNIANEGP